MDATLPRSRRAMLAGAFGAAIGAIAGGVGRPQPVSGANGDPVTVGGAFVGTGTTSFDTSASATIALRGISNASYGVVGSSEQGHGVQGDSLSGVGVKGFSVSSDGVFGESSFALGVRGKTFGATAYGVYGQNAASGTAVLGYSSSTNVVGPAGPAKTGVYGYADQGADAVGVRGEAAGPGSGVVCTSDSGFGLDASSSSNTAVNAVSGTGIDLRAGGTGRLYQAPSGATGAPTTGTYSTGEQIRDAAGEMWLCTLGGTPGTWRKVRLEPALGIYPAGTVTRISGASRYATAAAVSAATFAPGAPVAYIANAFNFPDALAGAAAAGTLPGPVLLAAPNLPLNASTTTELARLQPKRILVLGGTGVISDAVLAALAPYAVGG